MSATARAKTASEHLAPLLCAAFITGTYSLTYKNKNGARLISQPDPAVRLCDRVISTCATVLHGTGEQINKMLGVGGR